MFSVVLIPTKNKNIIATTYNLNNAFVFKMYLVKYLKIKFGSGMNYKAYNDEVVRCPNCVLGLILRTPIV